MSDSPPSGTSERTPRAARVSFRGGMLTIVVDSSALGTREAPAIAAEAIEHLDARGGQIRALVFDLGAVTFMNSTGLGMVIDLRNRAQAVGARTFAIGMHSDIREMFRMMKTDRLVEIVESQQEIARLLR